MAERPHRCGSVAILGRANAGKSTLLNRLVGEKLAIVTRKPQTTRSRILGIVAREDAQVLLYDTPGLHEGTRPLNRALLETVYEVAADCDVALLLVDPAEGFGPDHAALLARLAARKKPVLVVATKQDLPAAAAARLPALDPGAVRVLRVSAETGQGIPELLDALVALLPEGPSLYPEDDLTDRPERFLVAEEVREAAFEALSQELPYEIAVEIEDFDESRPDLVKIRAKLLVVRESQKRIVVGTGGEMVKRIGIQARLAIERRLGKHVHLELWMKVEPDWSQRPNRLKSLGYW